MPSPAHVTIHPSQFPEAVRRDLLRSLRTRRINQKFLYDSHRQTQKWLALHEAHSPARRDDDCLKTYDRAFADTAQEISAPQLHVLGLACGGGQKDARLLQLLQARGKKLFYTPCDVAAPMTLVARAAALKFLPPAQITPFVCDLTTAADLPEIFTSRPPPRNPRLITFFGTLHNFEPPQILPRLAALVRPRDWLLFSANLAPGKNYAAGMKKILPQYDNALTHDWLFACLHDLGVEPRAGKIKFTVERGGAGLQRIVARFHFTRPQAIRVGEEKLTFTRGETVQLFFSYRYTPALVQKNLARHGLKVCAHWLAVSGEEGVFLCRCA
ncbi:MAG: hypothetical protein RLZZ350_2496 [Verrucomicrobiota bacterium]|jgi:uncharacterized SAM-dependent methyltransferase